MTRSRITGKVRIGVTVIVSVSVEVREPGHAQQPRLAVDLGAAGAALAGLAVPADREVAGLGGLHPVDGVEDDLALGDLDRVVAELAAALVAAPDPHLQVVAHVTCLSVEVLLELVRHDRQRLLVQVHAGARRRPG